MVNTNGLEIAVIGMSGRFPSADNIEQFWELLQAGKEGLIELSNEELLEAGIAKEKIAQANYVRKAGIVNRKQYFDAKLFGYSARDAQYIDPQFGVFHEIVWEALESAGYTSEKFDGHIGIYAGATGNIRWLSKVMSGNGNLADGYAISSLTESGYLCSRVAHKLNFTGPAIATNATCATSLVNVHLACQGLNTGECDIALAGGVRIPTLEKQGYLYQEDMIMSPDGSCRPFDIDAAGTALGEGCGVLVLKRLEDAEADNDNILAVIKGSAINNDGELKVGFTAPSVEGQSEVISMALQRAEVEPGSIQYVETHGTATKLGDPIEIAALKQAFSGVAAGKVAIGSVKSNIGHLGEAAGVAGAIKTILSLKHKKLPPSINYTQPNPLLALEASPFFVNSTLNDWQAEIEHPRRAGVSSFGVGGTNAHIILEEYQEAPRSGPSRSKNILSLSANDEIALAGMEKNLADFVNRHPDVSMADICYTLHLGRRDLPYKTSYVVGDLKEVASKLESNVNQNRVYPKSRLSANHKLCFMFPGQGTQYIDMGCGLYEEEPVFRELMEQGFSLAKKMAGCDLKPIVYPSQSSDKQVLVDTEYVQPILFIFEYALAGLLESWGCRASAYVGHSLGEYVAACLAGVFSYEDALAIVIKRGQLVKSLPGGAMLAVPCSVEEITPLLNDSLSVAAINSPQRTVISGDQAAIDRLQEALTKEGRQGTRLHTSHALHSCHLDAVLGEFADFLSTITFNAPQTPFLSNVTGTWIQDKDAQSVDYWCRQLRDTVRFADCVNQLLKNNDYLLLEVGPGNVLSNFARQNKTPDTAAECVQTVAGASQYRSGTELDPLLGALCQLQVAGIELNWRAFYGDQLRRRVELPTYPFSSTCYYPDEWLRAKQVSEQPQSILQPGEAKPETAEGRAQALPADESLTPIQIQLLDIWTKYLGVGSLGLNDDLFSFGVDSLMSIRVITEIRKTFKIELSLDTIFTLKTVAEQAREIEHKLNNTSDSTVLPEIVVTHKRELPVLSASQRRLWMISQLDGDSTAYNNAFCAFIKGLCMDTLKRTVREVVDRHSILRTVYTERNGEPLQTILTDYEIDIPTVDISHIDENERFGVAEKMYQEELINPIALDSGLMIRVSLIKYDRDSHLLVVTQHHICSDNWSLNLLVTELGEIYTAYSKGENHKFPPLPVQYIDYANWQHEWMRQGGLDSQIAFWKERLAGAPEVHNVPTDFPRPKYQSYRGTQMYTRIGRDIVNGLNRFSQEHGATLFMTMQAAFAVLLGRYSNEDDIIVGFPVANRSHKEVEPLIGFFVNTLVLRTDLSQNPAFVDLLAQTKRNLLGCYSNAHLPFEMLVDALNPERSLSYEPIVQIQLVILDQSQEYGAKITEMETQQPDTFRLVEMIPPFSKYDLTLYFRVTEEGMFCAWEYSSDLFKADTIRRMASNFEKLLQSILENPQISIRSLPLLSEIEREQQFKTWYELESNSYSRRLYLDVSEKFQAPEYRPVENKGIKFSLFYFASDAGDRAEGKYNLLTEGAKFADKNGFEAIWTPERHFDSFGGLYPNPAITAAAIAAVTDNIKIRAGSCVLPLHNPVRVAEDWSVIDNISGGRVGLGFAAGWSAKDFTLAPGGFESRQNDLRDGVKTVKSLWRGEEIELPIGNGEAAKIKIRPCPLQPELPVWVTTTGNIDAFIHAGRAGDNVLTHLLGQSLDALAEKIAAYRREWQAAGHPGKGCVTLLAHTFIADNEAVIFEHVKEPFKNYLVVSAGTPQAIARVVGGAAAESILSDGLDNTSDLDAITELAFKRYYNSNALLGTVERCTGVVESIQAAGVDEIACLIDFGVDEGLVLDSLNNLNRLRQKFEEGEQDEAPEPAHPDQNNDTLAQPTQPGPCLHQIFEQIVARYPDAIALQLDNQTLTYAELNARANQLAHHLIAEYRVEKEKIVGICLERSLEMLIGILGILKAGGAYLALEPSTPQARMAHILAETGAEVVLTRLEDRVHIAESEVAILAIDDAELFSHYSGQNPQTRVEENNLSHIIYTSGSTGKPKGIMIEHRHVTRLFRTCPDYMVRGPEDVGCTFSSYAFDVSVWEIWGSLLYGGKLVIVPRFMLSDMKALYQLLVDSEVTQISMPSSAFYALQSFIPIKQHRLSLRNVLFGGEVLQPKLLSEWFQEDVKNSPRFVNLWGPAETTVYASARVITMEDVKAGCNNIGSSFKDVGLCVLSEEMQPQPIGVAGEVYVGGAGVSRGYLNNEQLTAESFVRNPLLNDREDRWYRTGDICRWLPDGSLEFLERKDNQIKLRGFRIELSEIDACLTAHESVKEAVVLAVGEGTNQHLAAYLVVDSQESKNDLISAVKQSLIEVLPTYMVPHSYTLLESMPLNSSGKFDRKALLALSRQQQEVEYIAARNETERALAAIWCELLGLEQVSVTANFFAVGGQSLVAIRMVNELTKRFNIEIQTKLIFEYSSIESLAVLIESSGLLRNQSPQSDLLEAGEVVEFDL